MSSKNDAAVTTDTSVVDAPRDGSSDASPVCLTDEFNGVALSTQWVQTVGAAPTLTVGTGVVTITDAAFAASAMPTVPGESWINDFDDDKGNQLRWDAPIGTRDFTLTAVVGWDSTTTELTQAGFALVNSANEIEVMVSARDSATSALGYPHAQIRVPGAADGTWAGALTATSTGTQLVVRRINGVMVVEHMGSVVQTNNNAAAIAGLAIVTVRYKDDSIGNVDYGTATLDRVSLCY